MVKKIGVFITILGLFFVGLPQFNLKAESYENLDYNNKNLAGPSLYGKEYLGDGWYYLSNHGGVDWTYNVYTGVWRINGTINKNVARIEFPMIDLDGYNKFPLTKTLIKLNDNVTTASSSSYIRIPDFYGNESALNVSTNNFSAVFNNYNNHLIELGFTGSRSIGAVYNNFDFLFQIEQGNTATTYTVPLKPYIFHEKQLAFNDGFDNGFDNGKENGLNQGYNDGFYDGLSEVFNENNLIPIAEKRGKGTTGPSVEYFGFKIPINRMVKQITLLNLTDYPLKDLSWSGSANVKQGFRIKYENSSNYIYFDNYYDTFEDIIEIVLDKKEIVEYIEIILAVNNPSMPSTDFDNMLNHMANNLGFYLNNKVLSDEAIDRFKEIMEYDLRSELDIEYQNQLDVLLDYYLDIEFQKGYERGLDETDATGFGGLLSAVFGGLGSLLAIELLPNIHIGAIIAVPLVFGIIFFILGKRKGD